MKINKNKAKPAMIDSAAVNTKKTYIHFAIFLLLLALICAVVGVRIDHRTYPLKDGKGKYLVEDAGISVVFAQYIASGEGIVYYPDGERVEGYSNSLWTFLVAALIRAGISPLDIPRPMGIFFTALGLFFAGLLAWRCLDGPSRWLGLLLPPVIGEAGTVVIWAVAGLENGLYAATLMAALVFFAHERNDGKHFPVSGFLFFLVAITRPEGMVFGGMAGLYVLATEIAPSRKITRNQIIFALSFLVPLGLFELWRLLYFAWPLPIPFYGKVTDRNWAEILDFKSRGWKYLLGYLKAYGYEVALALCPFVLLTFKKWRPSAFLIFPLALTLFFPVYSRGDWMKEWRFSSINTFLIITIALIASAKLAQAAWGLIGSWKSDEPKQRFVAIPVVIGALIFGFAVFGQFAPSYKHIAKFIKKPIVNTHKLQIRGKYFREMGDNLDLSPGSVLDVDMGGIGAASGMVIYDVGKLCDVPFGINQWHKDFVDQYVFAETKPDFLHVREGFGRNSTILGNPKLKQMYILLPQDRRLGWKRPNGNYVRKDLIMAASFDPDPEIRADFESGISIVGGRVYPHVAVPGQLVRFRVVWSAVSRIGRDLELNYLLKNENGIAIASEKRNAVMNWHPTSRWRAGEYPVDLIKFKIPDKTPEGRYYLAVRILNSTLAGGEIKDIALGLKVSLSGAEDAVKLLREKARGNFQKNPQVAAEALDALRYHANSPQEKQAVRVIKKDFAASLADQADALLVAGKEEDATELAVMARKLHHRSSKVVRICKKLADMSYRRGRELQKRNAPSDLDAAYKEFSEAVRRYPQHSWARRRAEETRPTGVLRKGLR